MFQKSLQNPEMDLPIVTASLSYAPEAALFQLDALKMLLHYAASVYLVYITALKEYLLESHAQLVHHITGLLQDHSISPVDLPYLSFDPSSFSTFLPSERGLPKFKLLPTGTLQAT